MPEYVQVITFGDRIEASVLKPTICTDNLEKLFLPTTYFE